MRPRGKAFADDQFIAESMEAEDGLARIQLKLEQLELDVSEAYIKYLDAEEKGLPSEEFKKNHARLVQEYEAEEKHKKGTTTTGGSMAMIQAGLGKALPVREEKKKEMVTAKRVLSAEEIKKVEEHHSKLPKPLQDLMEAVLGEDITLGLAGNVVFIRGEGHIYDRSTPETWLKDSNEAMLPHNQAKKFKRTDIIPSNTHIEALADLMLIIHGKEKEMKAPLSLNMLSYTEESLATKRVRIKPEVIALIEQTYQTFPDKHKILFNKMCRDPISNIIMDDPVFLPDGYIYDRSTAMLALKHGGRCPKNKGMTFTKDDITDCYSVRKGLEQLQKTFAIVLAAKNAVTTTKPSAPPESSIKFHGY